MLFSHFPTFVSTCLRPAQSHLTCWCFFRPQYCSSSNFSPSYQCIRKHTGHENSGIDHQKSIALMFKQVLPTSVQQNVWRPVRRICIIGNLSKHDGDGWRERHKTKGFISKTVTLHVRYRFWYISLPSSAKQQREMTKFKVLCRTWTHDCEFSFFYLSCNAVLTESAPGLFGFIRQIERVETIAKKLEIFGSHF